LSQSRHKNWVNEFSIFADGFLQKKFFTHCYASCGNLRSKKLYFEFFKSTDDSRTIFDLASLTKPLVTAVLLHKIENKRLINSSENLEKGLFPLKSGLVAPQIQQLIIQDLISHRSGLPPWFNFWLGQLNPETPSSDLFLKRHETIEEAFNRLASLDLIKTPGFDIYSDLGYILLGYLIEKKEGENLAELFESLKKETGYEDKNQSWIGFPVKYRGNISRDAVSTGLCSLRARDLFGEVQDENCASFGGVSGHAGLFGTGAGVTKFLMNLFDSDLGKSFFEKNLELFKRKKPLYGLRYGDDESSVVFGDGEAFGHMGFTGTAFWIDTRNLNYSVLLTNRVISGRISKQTKIMRKEGLTFLSKFCLESTLQIKKN
jgi:CubicO group peptidase (beta-lactamase class C family)